MVTHDAELVDQCGPEYPQPLPPPRRSPCGTGSQNNPPMATQPLTEFIVFHQGPMLKSSEAEKITRPEKQSLISIGHLSPARSQVGSPLHTA